MTEHLPPYSGDTATCLKCRGSEASTEYYPFRPRLLGNEIIGGRAGPVTVGDPLDECLLRTCRTCEWAWLEACADAGAPMDSTG